MESLSPTKNFDGRVIETIANHAGRLGIELADVSGAIEELATHVTSQAANFAQLQESSSEIAAQGSEIANIAATAREVVASASDTVTNSQQKVQQSLGDIRALASAVTIIETELSGLREALADVAKVAKAIASIAGQTNLLALNATIEAARAGDAGRGFAVVASEVKALSRKTAEATAEIDTAVRSLNEQAQRLIGESNDCIRRASVVADSTDSISSVIDSVAETMSTITEQNDRISTAAAKIGSDVTGVSERLSGMAAGVAETDRNLGKTRDQTTRLLHMGEELIRHTAALGVETEDTPFIRHTCDAAAKIGKAFEDAIEAGLLTEADVFDENYRPIAGSDPEQFTVRYLDLAEKALPPIQDAVLTFDPRISACVAMDRNGYLPVHHPQHSQPQRPGEADWNQGNSRNRRIFTDRTALAVCRNRETFLLQTYRRHLGGDTYKLYKDVTAPIMVRGRHWGGTRLIYQV